MCLRLLETHPRYRDESVAKLIRLAPIAIVMAVNLGKLEEATEWYVGPYHRCRIVTLGGIRRGVWIALAWLKYWLSILG